MFCKAKVSSLSRLLSVVLTHASSLYSLNFKSPWMEYLKNECSATQPNRQSSSSSFSTSAPVFVSPCPQYDREAQYVTTLVKALSQRYPQSVYYTMRAFLLERREQGDRGGVSSNADTNKLPKAMSVRLPGGGTVSGDGGGCGGVCVDRMGDGHQREFGLCFEVPDSSASALLMLVVVLLRFFPAVLLLLSR